MPRLLAYLLADNKLLRWIYTAGKVDIKNKFSKRMQHWFDLTCFICRQGEIPLL